MNLSLVAALLAAGLAVAAPVTLNLKDGSIVKGDVSSKSASDVVLKTEFGVARIPLEKLTDDSRRQLAVDKPLTAQEYEARIAVLEAKIARLEEENGTLRRAGSQPSTAAVPAKPSAIQPVRPPAAPDATIGYTISSTGKRHNSRCRFFSGGRPCGATDGVACKICGG